MIEHSGTKWLRLGTLLLVVVLLPFLQGCGKPKGIVTGTVTFQGRPLPGGFLTFVPEQGGGVIRGKIEQDGAYRLTDVPVGTVKIGIQGLEPPKHPEAMIPPEELAKGGKAPTPKPGNYVRIPASYNDPDKSGLSLTVTGGSQEHNITLK